MSSFELAPESYNGDWPENFKQEASKIKYLFEGVVLKIEHIGSTAVAGLRAKPIIDVIIEVKRGRLPELTPPLSGLGYTFKGENGIPGRAYFSRSATANFPATHLHAFDEGNFEIEKHLAFCNYLRAHEEVRKNYDDLKKKILAAPGITRSQYQELKSNFVSQQTEAAIKWYSGLAPIKHVKKSVIYVVREKNHDLEVLVFDHVKYPEVSPQVPSGTIEENEENLTAAKRELLEESGIAIDKKWQYLGFYEYYKNQVNQLQERNHFLVNGENLNDEWTHRVTGSGADKDFEFKYYWLPLGLAESRLQAGFGKGLEYFLKKKDPKI